MNKKEQKREKISEDVAQFILHHGIAKATLKNIASEINTSDRMLLHYFETKEILMHEALIKLAHQMIEEIEFQELEQLSKRELLSQLFRYVENESGKRYMNIFIEMLPYVQRGEKVYQQAAKHMFQMYYEWVYAHVLGENEKVKEKETLQIMTLLEGSIVISLLQGTTLPIDMLIE